MQNMDIHWLKKFEADFVQFLINGISDDKLDIGPMCIRFLEDHGKRMEEACKALGDDDIKTLHEQDDIPMIVPKAAESKAESSD
jgi:hypothetical protein